MRGRLRPCLAHDRDQVENAQALLSGALACVDELVLRTQQAMRRTPIVVDVLSPANDRLEELRQELIQAQRELAAYWSAQQARRWRDEG